MGLGDLTINYKSALCANQLKELWTAVRALQAGAGSGGGGTAPTPNLQAVTNVGSTTTNNITIGKILHLTDSVLSAKLDFSAHSGVLRVSAEDKFAYNLSADGLTDNQTYTLPDGSGVIPLTVNDTAPDSTGNITLNLSQYLTTVDAAATYLTISNAASNYVSLSGSYANPSWITSLAHSKITYTGTALQYVQGDGSFATFPDVESPLTFTNGLVRTSDTVALGGALTGLTQIDFDFNDLYLGIRTGQVGATGNYYYFSDGTLEFLNTGTNTNRLYLNNSSLLMSAARTSTGISTQATISTGGVSLVFDRTVTTLVNSGVLVQQTGVTIQTRSGGAGAYSTWLQAPNGTISYSSWTGTGSRILTASSTGVVAPVTNGSNGTFLSLIAGIPTWSSLTLSSITFGGTTAQYVRGDGSLATFPTDNTSFTNGAGFITSAAVASGYVPNIGATTAVNLGSQTFTTTGAVALGATTITGVTGITGATTVTGLTRLIGTDGVASTTSTPNGILRLGSGTANTEIDFGTNGTTYAWIQARQSNAATYNTLILNPNVSGITSGRIGLRTSTFSFSESVAVQGRISITHDDAYALLIYNNKAAADYAAVALRGGTAVTIGQIAELKQLPSGAVVLNNGYNSQTISFQVASTEYLKLSPTGVNIQAMGVASFSGATAANADGFSAVSITNSLTGTVTINQTYHGVYVAPTLTTGANNQALVGMTLAPTFVSAHTGFKYITLRLIRQGITYDNLIRFRDIASASVASPYWDIGMFSSLTNATSYTHWKIQRYDGSAYTDDISIAPTGVVSLPNGLSTTAAGDYADNAAALAAGLAVGRVYRTGDLLKIVH